MMFQGQLPNEPAYGVLEVRDEFTIKSVNTTANSRYSMYDSQASR